MDAPDIGAHAGRDKRWFRSIPSQALAFSLASDIMPGKFAKDFERGRELCTGVMPIRRRHRRGLP
jgi:hypothetical protein